MTVDGSGAVPVVPANFAADEARCFATRSYRVRSRPHPIGATDAETVAAYNVRLGDRRKLAYPLAVHAAARRRVPGEIGAEQDQALLYYINQRKWAMARAHRDWGDEGLKRMHRYQLGTGDVRVLELLRIRRLMGDRPLTRDRMIAAEIRLLLKSPRDFVPCQARKAGIV